MKTPRGAALASGSVSLARWAPVALRSGAAACWWLAMLALTVGAGWRVGGATQLYWFDLPLLATLVLWALALALDPAPIFRLGPRLPLAAVGGLAALALLSTLVAPAPHLALAMGARLLLAALLYLYLVNETPSPRAFALAGIAGLVPQAVVAVGQVARQSSLGLGFLGERHLDLLTSGVLVIDVHGRHWLRPYGLTADPNLLAGFAAVLSLPLALAGSRRLAALGLLLCSGLLLLTFSRGAWLAALLSLAVYLLGRRRAVRLPRTALLSGIAAAGALAAALVATPAGAMLASRFNPLNPLEQYSIGERISSQDTALTLIARHPFLGIGADNYGTAVSTGAAGQAYIPVVHNAFLLAAAEVGILGAVLLAVALLWPAWRLLRAGGAAPWPAALAAALVACAVVGVVDFYAWASPAFALCWVVLLGLWAAPARHASARRP